jgi:hypothetical protein
VVSMRGGNVARDDAPGGSRPEASERLSSRTLFTLSLSRWKLGLRLRDCLFKIAHLVAVGHSLQSPD